jgi:hypothetical protein
MFWLAQLNYHYSRNKPIGVEPLQAMTATVPLRQPWAERGVSPIEGSVS